MSQMIIGLVLFFGVHSVSIIAPSWRDQMVQRFGAGRWKAIYSLISIAGFLLLISGYASLRFDPTLLYVPPTGLRHVAALLMLPVFPLLLATYLPGRIKRAAKHPMLVAVKFWALAHLLANGMLADVLLFGSFLVWAVLDRISLKRRPVAATAATAAAGRAFNDVLVIVAGLALYAAFVMLWHERLFGVAPFV